MTDSTPKDTPTTTPDPTPPWARMVQAHADRAEADLASRTRHA